MKKTILSLLLFLPVAISAQQLSPQTMQDIYEEVRTPYKYGMVVSMDDNFHKADCPTVWREGDRWLMTYVVYDGKDGTDGRGYETWLAESPDLLHWTTLGRVLRFADATPRGQKRWDANQRGGFPALIDWTWGGSYAMAQYKGRHWMTYIGGHGTGYEAVREPLNIGLAWTSDNVATAHEWHTASKPLLSIADKDVQWWEQLVQYKSTVYDTRSAQPLPGELGQYRFLMFYNAGGVNPANGLKAERIGLALSNDMKHWTRYGGNPVFANEVGGIITGDAQIVKMDSLYVMFYFKAYDPSRRYNAYNTFAVSRDLTHWQTWDGPDLVVPSKPYDELFAHKSYVVKHQGVVYHFYCAVNNAQQRGIAVATSVPMGQSQVHFPQPEPTGKRRLTSLDKDWQATLAGGKPTAVNIPHNFDDYYGYRQLRHGNLHGSARYEKMFTCEKLPGKHYFLQFEGVGTFATVTLNGRTFPRELVGRTVWTLDVTEALANGQNSLSVLVDHPAMLTTSPWVCGGCSSEYGFSEGSQPFGIFRPVTLVETDEVRIEPFGVHLWANTKCDSVFVDTEVHNYAAYARYVEVVSKLAAASGKTVFWLSQGMTLRAGETRVLHQAVAVDQVHRWSLADPYLYTLTSMVKQPDHRNGGATAEPALITTDEVRTPFGFRTISWPLHHPADNHFLLNGQPVFINGTCEYEHLLGQSHAFTPEQIRSRVKQIRHAGFNAFREAHQPHNLLYQQLFDEQGMLFWSQFSAHIWYDTPQFRQNFKRLLERWVRERRNSPSVILWGLQNESVLPRDFAQECTQLIRSLDPTASDQRLVTTCNGGEGTDWNVVQNWSGTYGGSAENYAEELARPDQLLNGEYGAWRTLDLHGSAKYSEENFTHLLALKAQLAGKAFETGACGHFQWLFASHENPGRVQPDGALRRTDKIGPVNYKGLTTLWEEPTQAYYMYKKMYTPAGRERKEGILNASVKGASGWHYLYRINCGGDACTDEYGQQWQADDSLLSHSWGQDFAGIHAFQASQRHIDADIRGTASDQLFRCFRYGRHRLWYDLPVTQQPQDARYRVELYFLEPWHGKDGSEDDDFEGLRIFDVAVNDSLVVDDLDPWAEAGYCGALKRVVYATARSGKLHIAFPEVKAGQAVIAAIAVAIEQTEGGTDQEIVPLTTTWRDLDADTIAKLPSAELPTDTEPRPATVYEPSAVKGGTSFTVTPGLGQEYALRFRYKNTTGNTVRARLTLTDAKQTVLVDRELAFPPTPDKFKMLSTTTGTQINAGTYTLTVAGEGIVFKNMEMQ